MLLADRSRTQSFWSRLSRLEPQHFLWLYIPSGNMQLPTCWSSTSSVEYPHWDAGLSSRAIYPPRLGRDCIKRRIPTRTTTEVLFRPGVFRNYGDGFPSCSSADHVRTHNDCDIHCLVLLKPHVGVEHCDSNFGIPERSRKKVPWGRILKSLLPE